MIAATATQVVAFIAGWGAWLLLLVAGLDATWATHDRRTRALGVLLLIVCTALLIGSVSQL